MDFWGPSMRDAKDTQPRTLLIRERVGERIPIIGVGGVKNAVDAQKVLNAGIPLVALGRELLMEPDWGVKVQQNSDKLRVALELKSQHELVIPDQMWGALISRKGWIPIAE